MKILIHGFPHTGTTLLRKILSSVDYIHEIKIETNKITQDDIRDANGKIIVIKFPFSYTTFYTNEYEDYIKIFVIRNPYYIYSSINKRFKNDIPLNHNINRCLNTINNFMYFKNKVKNTFFIKYEEMFDNNFCLIRNIFETLKIPYSNDIFKNKEIIKYDTIPSEEKETHSDYRLWQIQQPYTYKDNNRPVYLTKEQLEILDNSEIMKRINYSRPNIVHIFKDNVRIEYMNYIDKIYYINLEYRCDRKDEFLKCMKDLNIVSEKIQRIPAIHNPSFGTLGCTRSHILALETFLASDSKICMICEDDFQYKNSESFNSDVNRIFESKIVFDVIQLSYNHLYRPELLFKVTDTEFPFIKKVQKTISASSYIITREFAPKLIENFKESSELLEKYGLINDSMYALDVYWHRLQPTCNWYIIYPSIGYQRASYSDNCQNFQDYGA